MNTFCRHMVVESTSHKTICLTVLLIIIHLCSHAQVVVWEEHFNGTTLDEAKWTYDIGDGCDIGICGWGNAELQYYRKQNVRVENGNLVIEARRESVEGKFFSSGRIKSLAPFHFKYGTLEARIKIPDLKNGLWPAFWTLGVTGIWPASGEIDIMEMGQAASYPNNVNNWVGAATHWEHQGGLASYAQTYRSPTPLSDDYHIYKLVWTSSAITVYVDNIQFYVINIAGGAAADLEEFHNPHYILFNLAVGGRYTGITTVPGITAAMPAQLLVDYVKLTQELVPVKLTDFSVSTNEHKNVAISWTTTNEENSDYFIVEKSTDGASFKSLGTVISKGRMDKNSYQYEDTTPAEGINYYRLVQVDKDGRKTIYQVRQVRFFKTNAASFLVIPNPVKGKSINLLFSGSIQRPLNIQVADQLGKIILNVNEKPDGNVLTIRFNKKPAPGVYIIQINNFLSKKFLVE